MELNEIIELRIEKFSNLGYGIAKHEGIVVFVENACPEDIVECRITKVTKNYANAKIEKIITPSLKRVESFCAMQKVCGACQMQFIDYDYQLELKRTIVQDAITKIAGLDIEVEPTVPSPQQKEYRHKIQYPISETKNSKRILAGYYKTGTHEIVNIKHCPIQPEICNEIMEFIRTSAFDYAISGYNEKKHSGDLRHVVIRVSASTGKILVTLVVNSTKVFDRLKDFANEIKNNFKVVTGVCVNFNTKKTNVILSDKTELVCGKDFIKERVAEKTFHIGPNTFFQVNPKSAENIFLYVKNYISENFDSPIVLDAYAGVTSFGIIISDVCKKVVSVEENKECVNLAQKAIEVNELQNIELHNMDAQKFFDKELKTKKRRFDAVILDPPRKGCTEESLRYALSLCKDKIIYVSCNPATLARDLKFLTSFGAKVLSVKPFDMFCHTYHVESVSIIDVKDVNI